MADAPWRCSQCGTINEPVANACRTCGRWPSLFDLQESIVEDAQLGAEQEPTLATQTIDVEPLEVPTLEEPQPFEADPEPDVDEEPTPSRWRRAVTAIPPIAVLIYIIISNVLNR